MSPARPAPQPAAPRPAKGPGTAGLAHASTREKAPARQGPLAPVRGEKGAEVRGEKGAEVRGEKAPAGQGPLAPVRGEKGAEVRGEKAPAGQGPLAEVRGEKGAEVRGEKGPTGRGDKRATSPRGDKREAILEAALELFVERGFHGTAVPEVAERAGVGAGTIYRYFASKEALVNALYQREKGAIAARMLDDFPVDASAREQFRQLWQRMSVYVAEHPLSFAFLELHNHASYLDDASRAIEQRILTFGVSFVQNAQRKGELRPGQPLLLIGIVLGAFVGLVSKAEACGLALDREAWATAEQCMWEAIRI
ncbi:MAG TPA: TetR family transcriptional regulator [Kofleriaceae bacterium]|nr:TetR family transcriptional regulator [Kofleriaceae bacterium]